MGHFVEIVRPDGATERHPLIGRVVIGRRPQEGIAVPTAVDLEPEHVLVVVHADGCWVSIVEGARVGGTVRGQRFEGGVVPWGTEVQVGSLRVRVGDDAAEAAASETERSPVAMLAMLGLLAAAAWLFLWPDGGDELPAMAQSKPPELVGAAPACAVERADAPGQARESAEAAQAKSERYPFAAHDGVQAIELYGAAASCFALAGQDAEATAATRARERMVAQVTEDYRTHQLKLERAISNGRTRQALTEARALLAMVSHLDHPYTTWLRSLERRLALKVRR